jgi:hypothetical protein
MNRSHQDSKHFFNMIHVYINCSDFQMASFGTTEIKYGTLYRHLKFKIKSTIWLVLYYLIIQKNQSF